MTVPVQTPYNNYVGNAATTAFSYNFLVLLASDLIVKVSGVTLVNGVGYTVSGIGSVLGGTVTMTSAPAALAPVAIYRSTAITRAVDYQSNGDFLSPTVNADFDRPWLVLQELFSGPSGFGRMVKAPVGETIGDLPAASVRAGNLLSFDSNGNPIAAAAVAGSATQLAIDLASSALSTKNSGQIGFNYALGYASGTLGKWQQDLALAAGSTFFGWGNSGANAVLRTVSNKLRDFANASDYATLTDAFAAADTVFVTSANYPVTGNTTVAKTKRLVILAGGSITVSTGVTLTLNCEVDASLRQVFAGLGSVVGIRQVCPEWFGALGTGAGDDILALEAAHNCVLGSLNSAGGRPTIFLKSPQYQISRGWIVAPTANINLCVQGNGIIYSGSRIVAASTFSPAGPVFQVAGNANAIQQIADWAVRDIAVVPSAGGIGAATIGVQIGSDSSALNLIGEQKSVVENVFVTGFPTCWKVIHARLVSFRRCSGWNDTFAGAAAGLLITQAGGFTGDLEFDDCQFVANGFATVGVYCVSILSSSGAYNPATGANQVAGIKFRNCDFYAGYQAVRLYAGATSWLTDIWFIACQADQKSTNNLYVESNNASSNVQDIHWVDCYASQAAGVGAQVSSTGTGGGISDLFFHDSWFDRDTLESINIFGGGVGGVSIHHNHFSNPGYAAGQCVTLNTCKGVSVDHNKVTRTNGTSTVAYIVTVVVGTNHYVVDGNLSQGFATTAPVNDGGGAVTKYLAGNI